MYTVSAVLVLGFENIMFAFHFNEIDEKHVKKKKKRNVFIQLSMR